MLKTIKDVVSDYAIIGGVMALLTTLIRPFITVKDTLRDCTITFLISMGCGLLMEYWEIPLAVKYGVAGMGGLFAVRIYSIFDKTLKRVEENPEKILDKIK